MFANERRKEIIIRIFLIAAILCNALIPETVSALSRSTNEEVRLLPPKNNNEAAQTDWLVAKLSRLFQDSTPTTTETPIPELSSTPSPTFESTLFPSSTPEYTSTPISTLTLESTQTPIPSQTPVPTQTSQPSTELPQLSIEFSAMPNEARVGDEVNFTIKFINQGQSPVSGLSFSNFLPEGFQYIARNNKEIGFNEQTRELTWVPGNETPLQAGQNYALEYSVMLIPVGVEDVQIIDTANIRANGLENPIAIETTLLLAAPGNSLISLDATGGEASGFDGRVKLKFHTKSLDAPRIVSIRGLNGDSQTGENSDPWIEFELGLRIPQVQDTQTLEWVQIENATPEQTTTIDSPETVTPVPTDEGSSQENDSVNPLMAVGAEFEEPVELTVSLDGLTELAMLGADQSPFLVTLDEESNTWVRMPLKTVDREANTITAELPHFSTWGVGLGSSFPTNSANILLFDSAYPSLFTGNSNYSIPLWTPPGRNGMQPNLTLSYSSGTVNGVLGDVQAPWVGMGWNIDSVEIARRITNGGCSPCGGGSYGYKNEFLLLLNGTGYELISDSSDPRYYHTKPESFLVIERHNQLLGNFEPLTSNATGEWWEVKEKDGKHWRLGWTPDSEQLAAMKGYPGINWTPTYSGWGALGYAGYASDRVALRWRADRVFDTYGNGMTFTYEEETQAVIGTSTNYERASYLDRIDYTSHVTQPISPMYSVVFERENRGDLDIPTSPTVWDNWDTDRLDRIDVYYDNLRIVRQYRMDYEVRSYSDDGKTWQTTTLKAVTTSGTSENNSVEHAPTVMFTYTDLNNRADHTGWQEWAYPRLGAVSNGWEGSAWYDYSRDDRSYTSWYNWRVLNLKITDGIGVDPMLTTFDYSTPCYNDASAGRCNASNVGELIGYGQTTATTKDFNGTTTLAIALHKFHTDEKKSGREYEVQNQNPSGTILRKTLTSYSTYDSPTGGFFTYANQMQQYLDSTLVSQTAYTYDTATGNLTIEKEYDGTPTLYRQTAYEYVMNTAPTAWILNTVSRRTLKDGNGAVISTQEYGYNSNLPGISSPMTTKPTLSRVVNGTQTIDTAYVYDSYGNVIETCLYKNFGTTGSQPTGNCNSYFTSYADDPATSEDDNLQTYVTSSTNPLGQVMRTHYDYGTGLPTTITDLNGNTTTTTYDGIGRVLEVKYPGDYGQPNIKYTYPVQYPNTLPDTYIVYAPFAVKMEMWDETASVYRSAWQVTDGLGRVIQTQGPYEIPGYLVLSDTSYNAQGRVQYSGLPRYLERAGGTHYAPNWGSVPHTTTIYDALTRVAAVNYPDSSVETYNYWVSRTALIDRNGHKKVQQNDAFGRLRWVEEYTGGNPYALYAVTTYEYDERDLLKKVTDTASNQTTITYDGFGRKTAMTDPDLGNWRYRYDAPGNLTAQIDAKRQAINMYYDDLNRLLGKTYAAGPVNADTYQPPADPGYSGYTIKYYYDSGTNGIGRRTSMVDAGGTTSWTYNGLGQATNETHNIESIAYSTSATFDAFGRPLTQTLPSTETLNYSYNAMGALSGLSGTNTYLSQIHYAASGQVSDQLLGNGLLQQSCYDTNTLRLSKLRVYPGALQTCGTTPSNPRLNLSYSYQLNGNVNQIVDPVRSETLNYSYDELDRLLNVNGSYNQNYTYEATGNLTSKGVPTSLGTTGLAAWWSMNETSATRNDSYGANHLTDNNTVGYAGGLKGNAASFVPANLESLSRTDNAALSTGDIDFTLVANVYLNSTANLMVIANKGLQNSATRDYLLVYDPSASKFVFSVGNGTVSGYISSQETITYGQWYTIAAWHDAVNNTLNIQVNSGAVSSASYTSGAMDTTYPLSIGAHSNGSYGLDGRIDEVVLYKRVLTASERIWLYNNGAGRAYTDLTFSNPGTTSLTSWWSLNETSAARNDSYGTNHLTDNNTVGYAGGLKGNAASFVPANLESLSRTDNATLSTGNIDFTLVANVYLNSTSSIMVIANKGDQNNQNVRDYTLYNGAGNFGFRVGNGTTTAAVTSPQPVTAGTWYTIVAWHDAVNNTLNIQVNNGAVTTASYSGGAMDTTYPLSIGAHSNGSYGLDGRIDEVALYKRVLNASERAWLYNNGAGRSYADLALSAPGTPSTYTYGNSAHKHAVTALSTGETYTYDANGNMITRVENGLTYTQTFDIENRLASVTVSGQTTQFIYDGDGNLVKKINPDNSKTIYVGGVYEVDKTSADSVTRTVTYYPIAGAMRINSTLYYILKDHLGSASVVTDSSGNIVGENRYYPFGETRFTTGTMYTDKLFTGQREMEGLGIYHYGARFYSPYINRFLSADTIIPDPSNPQSWNRYSYVLNNPLRYTDPTGHSQCQTQEDCDDMGTTPMGTGSSGGSGSGGGGHPQPSPDPNSGGDECPDWNVCVTDISSDLMHDYWTANNDILGAYNQWTIGTGIGAFVSAVASYVAYSISNGGPIFTPQFIALVTGVALIEPTAIGEFALATTVVLGATSFGLDTAASNLQNINNAIVDSGALNTGGTIIASPTQVTIVTPGGATTVPSILVGQSTLNSWASGNPNLVTTP